MVISFVCVGGMGKVRGIDSVQKSKYIVNIAHDAEQARVVTESTLIKG